MTAPLVVDAGKKAGFDFSTSLVYAVRGRMKKGGGSAPSSSRREGPVSKRGPSSGSGRLEVQLEELVRAFVQDLATLVRRAALESVRDALGDRSR